jgi:hypothetical protein
LVTTLGAVTPAAAELVTTLGAVTPAVVVVMVVLVAVVMVMVVLVAVVTVSPAQMEQAAIRAPRRRGGMEAAVEGAPSPFPPQPAVKASRAAQAASHS